jgi:hypothetical protein
LKRGTGVKARARVKLADGTKLKGYISESAADDFTLVRADENIGAPVKINYRDVSEFKAQGKGMSTTSKVLLGTGIAVGVTVVALALAFRNLSFSFDRRSLAEVSRITCEAKAVPGGGVAGLSSCQCSCFGVQSRRGI